MVHFERNLLSKVPAKDKEEIAGYIKQIYSSPNKGMAMNIADLIADRFRETHPKFVKLLEDHIEGTLVFFKYPKHHRKKIRTTNLIKGVINTQLKKRAKGITIFPNRESCIRYAACILMEMDEDWQILLIL